MKGLTGPMVGFAAALLLVSPAFAQQSGGGQGGTTGSTTGPAAGSNVTPSTATQKQNPGAPAGAGAPGAMNMPAGAPGGATAGAMGAGAPGGATAGAMGAGAPGVAAKPGSEAGPAQKKPQ